MVKIVDPYLLTVSACIKVDQEGRRWADPLWAKDLALHLEYITHLTLICPQIYEDPAVNDVALTGERFDRISFVEFPKPLNHRQAIKALPKMICTMWRAVGRNAIVHTGFGGWPISEGSIAAPIARMRGKYLITNVESSFWRTKGRHEKWFNIVRGAIVERVNRWCIGVADLKFFTSRAYLQDFVADNARSAFVIPATWIDSSVVLSKETAEENWSRKGGKVNLLFAGRLTPEKGVQVLLDALHELENADLKVSIIGEGVLRRQCEDFAEKHFDLVTMLEPVTYGSAFFELLRNFDAVVVPSISDEQPRIVFDAFCQGIPVIGAATGGISEVVETGIDGCLVDPGDPVALSVMLQWASRNRLELRRMGLAALGKSRKFTHYAMHATRSQIIATERKSRGGRPPL